MTSTGEGDSDINCLSLRRSQEDWVALAEKSAQGVRFCNEFAAMVAGNEDQTREARIKKLEELRVMVISITNRVHHSDQRIGVLRKLDAQLTALQESLYEVNESSTSFNSAFIRTEFQQYLQSLPPTPPLSPQCYMLRIVNIHLQAMESNEEVFEQAVECGTRQLADRCPILNAALQDPYFSRRCAHRYSAEGLLLSFNHAQEPRVQDCNFISDIPKEVSIPCPVAGCSALLTANVLQRDFLGVETKCLMPESSPLDIMDSQLDTGGD